LPRCNGNEPVTETPWLAAGQLILTEVFKMIHIDQEKCTGCTTCASVCPHRVLEVNNKKAGIAGQDRCIECGACQLNCPQNAVAVTKGTGCLFIIIKEDILGLKQDACACG